MDVSVLSLSGALRRCSGFPVRLLLSPAFALPLSLMRRSSLPLALFSQELRAEFLCAEGA